jgi:hypothetical protein
LLGKYIVRIPPWSRLSSPGSKDDDNDHLICIHLMHQQHKWYLLNLTASIHRSANMWFLFASRSLLLLPALMISINNLFNCTPVDMFCTCEITSKNLSVWNAFISMELRPCQNPEAVNVLERIVLMWIYAHVYLINGIRACYPHKHGASTFLSTPTAFIIVSILLLSSVL